MESKVGEAIGRFKRGYNCSQAVVCTYCEELGFDEVDAFKMAEAFGFGMGTMSVCGAISGACMLVGMKYSDGNTLEPKSRSKSYKVMKGIIKDFEGKNSSCICKEIKGVGTGEVLRSCGGCVADACALVEKHIFEIDIKKEDA